MDGEVVGATPPGATGGGADALTGLAFLLVPESQAYQAILGVLAEEPERSRTVGEIAAAVGADPAIVESRLAALVGWGDVSRTAEARTVAEYREGAVRFGLSELGGRVWREVCRTSLAPPPEPAAPPVDRARLLSLARRFDESSDAEAVALYATAIGLPPPMPLTDGDVEAAENPLGTADEFTPPRREPASTAGMQPTPHGSLTHPDREPATAPTKREPRQSLTPEGREPGSTAGTQPTPHGSLTPEGREPSTAADPQPTPHGSLTHPGREPATAPTKREPRQSLTPESREPGSTVGMQPTPHGSLTHPGREPGTGGGPSPIPYLSGGFVRAAQTNRDRAAQTSRELREACSDLGRRRLSTPAFTLLASLIGRALAGTVPGSDGYLADEASGLELHLLHSPGASTPLYGAEGTMTLDGFKLRLSALPAEGTGGV